MKILMLVNWKVKYTDHEPDDLQPPDYYIKNKSYWFFRYFVEKFNVDIVDIHSFPFLERLEKEKFHFYLWQTLRVMPRISHYDIIISHGMQSGVVLSLFRRIFHTKAKHVVFDIGSFNSAAESGIALRLMQFSSKSVDGFIYHTSQQIEYYKKYFPWIVSKAQFIPFGTDAQFFQYDRKSNRIMNKKYIICVGYSRRDWKTLCDAYVRLDTEVELRLVGNTSFPCNQPGINKIPFVPVKELMEQISNALFCVVPLENFNYSFGQMTLLQQMVLSKAVIAAKVPSMIDYIRDNDTALFYEPGNAEDLSQKMQLLIQDDEKRERIGKRAAQYVQEDNNEKKMAIEIEKFLKIL